MKKNVARHCILRPSLKSLRYLGYLRLASLINPPKKRPVLFRGSPNLSSSTSTRNKSHTSMSWRCCNILKLSQTQIHIPGTTSIPTIKLSFCTHKKLWGQSLKKFTCAHFHLLISECYFLYPLEIYEVYRWRPVVAILNFGSMIKRSLSHFQVIENVIVKFK